MVTLANKIKIFLFTVIFAAFGLSPAYADTVKNDTTHLSHLKFTFIERIDGYPRVPNVKVVAFDGVKNYYSTPSNKQGKSEIWLPPGVYKYTYQLFDNSGKPLKKAEDYQWNDLFLNPEVTLNYEYEEITTWINRTDWLTPEMGYVHFDSNSLMNWGDEGTTVTLNVYRTGDNRGKLNVYFRVSDDSAEELFDYEILGSNYRKKYTLLFNEGESVKPIKISLHRDDLKENPESFSIELIDTNLPEDPLTRRAFVMIKDKN
ncbi:Calx-beta domain-containing protein [Paenibacillus sp. SI8]|uniref:Calx-beta domain-containing protein n=1 Tax=unclassified Paenibacillus TaxID=185978 RepID=UPI00346632C0